MPKPYLYVFLFALIGLFQSCKNKEAVELMLDEKPYLEIENPYTQKIYAGQEDGINKMILVFPGKPNPTQNIIDSVYFKGFCEALKSTKIGGNQALQATFNLVDQRDSVQSPFEITQGEAIVSYRTYQQKRRYFKVTGIVEKEPIYMP